MAAHVPTNTDGRSATSALRAPVSHARGVSARSCPGRPHARRGAGRATPGSGRAPAGASRMDFATLMAVGVNAPRAVRQALHHEAAGLPVQIVPYVEDSVSAMAAADLVVCMAGYNTLAEVLDLGRKALVVPRAGPSAEQQMRCHLFAQRNLIDVLYPAQLSPQTLAERLLLDLERDDYPSRDGVVDTHAA